MKILVLAWEFPPRIVGGIARHVAGLYPEIVKLNHEIHLITVAVETAPVEEEVVPVASGLHLQGHLRRLRDLLAAADPHCSAPRGRRRGTVGET